MEQIEERDMEGWNITCFLQRGIYDLQEGHKLKGLNQIKQPIIYCCFSGALTQKTISNIKRSKMPMFSYFLVNSLDFILWSTD